MAFERYVGVPGSINFRDVGDYEASVGRRTRARVLFRCGALHDLDALLPLAVRTVLDLRGPAEIEYASGRLGPLRGETSGSGGVKRVALPLIPIQLGEESGSEVLDREYGHAISASRYYGYLELAAPELGRAFDLLSSPGALPAVVHCSAGKDRTGVLIALVLDVLGVAAERIVEDYALSNAALPQLLDLFGVPADEAEGVDESFLARLGAPPEAMRGFLERLHREYGSARGFLRESGVRDEVFERLEAALLSDGSPHRA